MSAVWLIVGVIVGAGVTALVMRERIRALLETQEQLRANQVQMADSFKAMSAEALDASMKQLTELAKSQLQSTQVEAKGELEKRQLAVEQLVRPLRDQLQRVDQQLLALNKERHQSQGMLAQQMRHLAEANEKLRLETGALVTALRKPNARGQWGQMQLRKVVELAGMINHCDFNEQASFDGDERTLRPDMVVNLPGGKHVVVDAKAPLQGILDAYEAPDEQTRIQHLQAHARLLRKHVKQLSDKAYWSGMDSAPDFVVLFLPGEHLYGAALEADPELIEDAMARRVLIATPTTLLALLHSVGYGWQQERVAESAQAISELGRELHGRLAKLLRAARASGRAPVCRAGCRRRRHRVGRPRADHRVGPGRDGLRRRRPGRAGGRGARSAAPAVRRRRVVRQGAEDAPPASGSARAVVARAEPALQVLALVR
jgi:DNA recombination protein RmuC